MTLSVTAIGIRSSVLARLPSIGVAGWMAHLSRYGNPALRYLLQPSMGSDRRLEPPLPQPRQPLLRPANEASPWQKELWQEALDYFDYYL